MITWTHGTTTFIGNSDLSGMVIVRRGSHAMEVPGHDLLEFIAGHVARERIRNLEQSGHGAILGIAHVAGEGEEAFARAMTDAAHGL